MSAAYWSVIQRVVLSRASFTTSPVNRSFARLSLILLVLALAACDGTEVDNSADDLVGAWLIVDVSQHDYATASRHAAVLDQTRPGVGDLAITGDATLSLRYLTQIQYPGNATSLPASIVLSSHPQDEFSSPPDLYAHLFVERSTFGGAVVNLTVGRGYEVRSYYLGWQEEALFTETGLSLSRIEVRGYDGSEEERTLYTISGTLAFAATALTAGVETPLSSRYALYLDPAGEFRHVFEADGTYRNESSYGDRTTSVLGTWTAAGERVRVSIPNLHDMTFTEEYTYRVEAGGLTLTTEPAACSEDCVRARERDLGLERGTLTAIRAERTYLLMPTTSRSRPWDADAKAEIMSPADLRARLFPGTEAAR